MPQYIFTKKRVPNKTHKNMKNLYISSSADFLKITSSVLIVLMSHFVFGQTANQYQVSTNTSGVLINPSYTSLIGTGVDDQASSVQSIGFNFVYEGVTYTQFSANSNGLVRLGATAVSGAYSNDIDANANQPKLMPFWDDLSTGSNGGVRFGVSGTAPNRVCVIDFRNNLYPNMSSAFTMRFQVRLYESSHTIELFYENGASSNSSSIGIGGVTSTNYHSITSSSHTTSTSTENNNNTNWPGNGRLYIFQASYAAQLVSMNTGANEWCAGESRTVSVTIRNIGLLPWIDGSGEDFNVGVKWNNDADYFVRVDAQNLVSGATATFNFTLTAPVLTGSNNVSFNVVREGFYWFGGPFASAAQNIKPFPINVSAGSDIQVCNGSSSQLTGTADVPPTSGSDLANVLSAINNNTATLLGSIPTPAGFSFDAGLNSNYISDGCSDMYDGGNRLNTNLASSIYYTDNAVLANAAAFGTGGQYFTRVIGSNACGSSATIFFWAADISGLTSISITGNNGADGSGTQNINTFNVTANAITYSCFVKRVYGASDPSINQIFFIPQPNSASQSMGTSTDDNLHSITGITDVTRIYYMLYAGASGAEITLASAQNIAQTFVNIIPTASTSTINYSWTPSASLNNANISNPIASPSSTTTYSMTANLNGCSVSDQVVATVVDLMSDYTQTPTGCNGSNDGAATAMVVDGLGVPVPGTYTYSWSNGNTTSTIINQATGSYPVTITDVNGCHTNTTAVISGPAIPSTIVSASGTSGDCNIISPDEWVYIVNSSNQDEVIASVFDATGGVDLNSTQATATIYGSVQYQNSQPYLQRVVTVTPTVQGPANVRIYFTDAEYSALLTADPTITGLSDLTVTKCDDGTFNNCVLMSAATFGVSPIGTGYYTEVPVSSFSSFYIHKNNNAPLPVELNQFEANCQEDNISIEWSTSSEINNAYFVIERSTDNKNYEYVAEIKGAGNSNEKTQYAYADYSAPQTQVYYRLLQVDFDGKFEYHKAISSDCYASKDHGFVAYQSEKQTISIKTSLTKGEYSLSVIDQIGRVVYNSNINVETDGQIFNCFDNDFLTGMFQVNIYNSQNKWTEKVITKP